jgi:predicted Zn-dependent protease with MMP-like domain
MNRDEFERVVAAALDGLPGEVAALLENIAVVVEDEPSDDDLISVGLDPESETLFGLYQGVAMPERGATYGNVLPDRIAIYRRPLIEACHDRDELVREIRDTVVHEVGHYFGLGEEDLP